MLNADLQLSHDAASKKKEEAKNVKGAEIAGAFHFIAFVPIEGQLWKLDGLERQPQKLCAIETEEWIYQTKPQLEAQMAAYEEGQIEFSILSLVKAPLAGLVSALAWNVKSLFELSNNAQVMEDISKMRIYSIGTDLNFEPGSVVCMPDPVYGLTQEMISQAIIPPAIQDTIQSKEVPKMIQLWSELTTAQAKLKVSIREEQLSNQLDQERADSRRFDYSPSIHNIIRVLAEKHFFTAFNI